MAEKRGTAEIVEMGFDIDEVKRYAVFKFDPPLEDGRVYLKKHYIAATLEPDGSLLQAPVLSDEHEISHLKTYCAFLGYDLVTD